MLWEWCPSNQPCRPNDFQVSPSLESTRPNGFSGEPKPGEVRLQRAVMIHLLFRRLGLRLHQPSSEAATEEWPQSLVVERPHTEDLVSLNPGI